MNRIFLSLFLSIIHPALGMKKIVSCIHFFQNFFAPKNNYDAVEKKNNKKENRSSLTIASITQEPSLHEPLPSSSDSVKNLFLMLPPDVQKYLLHNFILARQSDEVLIQKLQQNGRLDQSKALFYAHDKAIYRDDKTSDLVLDNKKLTNVEHAEKFSFTNDDTIKHEFEKSKNRISKFTISPDKKYLVALQTLDDRFANGLWIINLMTNQSLFRPLAELFSEHYKTVKSIAFDYLDELHREENFRRFFFSDGFGKIAISNDGIIALSVPGKIMLLKPNNTIPLISKEYTEFPTAIEFNEQGTKLGIYYKNSTNENIDFMDIKKENPKLTLIQYFHQKGICKQLQ